jgi:hypothetical protein
MPPKDAPLSTSRNDIGILLSPLCFTAEIRTPTMHLIQLFDLIVLNRGAFTDAQPCGQSEGTKLREVAIR